jgi:hypothetical protein
MSGCLVSLFLLTAPYSVFVLHEQSDERIRVDLFTVSVCLVLAATIPLAARVVKGGFRGSNRGSKNIAIWEICALVFCCAVSASSAQLISDVTLSHYERWILRAVSACISVSIAIQILFNGDGRMQTLRLLDRCGLFLILTSFISTFAVYREIPVRFDRTITMGIYLTQIFVSFLVNATCVCFFFLANRYVDETRSGYRLLRFLEKHFNASVGRAGRK